MGSFQSGHPIPNSDPARAAWREVRRYGTVDNLKRVLAGRSLDPALAEDAAVRIEQALELEEASGDLSLLTRPITQYYASLNLVRGALIAMFGDPGRPTHGLSFKESGDLMGATAEVNWNETKRGTFAELLARELPADSTVSFKGASWSLGQLLRSLPQMWRHYPLIGQSPPLFARVRVTATFSGAVTLRVDAPGLDDATFRSSWKERFPSLVDVCALAPDPLTLAATADIGQDERERTISGPVAFCTTHLLEDLDRSETATWFVDYVPEPEQTPRPSVLARYVAALFILSNIARYSPGLLAEPARRPTNHRLLIDEFLDDASIRVPQLMMQHVEGVLRQFR